jgi:Winged helix DNA-binding domain
MTASDIINLRLANQQLTGTNFKTPVEVIRWLGAMQAQEYAMAKWAIGLRLPGIKESGIEKAFNEGSILRTHVLRPTWHFVLPEDIRWMLELTAPRVNAFNAYYYRFLELDKKIFKKTNNALIKILQGGKQLTRTEIGQELERAKIKASGQKLGALMMSAELDAVICSGAKKGKQFTYALLDERAPLAKSLTREEALFELTRRYFTSRGPAMLHDFVWWSGLTVKDAKDGIAMLPADFVHETIKDKEYIFKGDVTASPSELNKPQATFLMPDYDEYGIAYKDRSAIFDAEAHAESTSRGNPVFNRMIVVNGRIVGSWKPKVGKKSLEIETVFFKPLAKSRQGVLGKAIKRYKDFWNEKRAD